METGIVLIHGAGLSSSIWDKLIPDLEFPSMTATFPAEGTSLENNSKQKFADYTNHIADQVNNWDVKKYVMVCHSIGGIIGLETINKVDEQISGFLVISSVIPEENNSFISSLPFPQKHILGLIMKLAGTKPPKKAITTSLCSGIEEALAEEIAADWTKESINLYTHKIAAQKPDCIKGYLTTLNDKELTTKQQTEMTNKLEATEKYEIDSGHMPMIEKPSQLAQTINGFTAHAIKMSAQKH